MSIVQNVRRIGSMGAMVAILGVGLPALALATPQHAPTHEDTLTQNSPVGNERLFGDIADNLLDEGGFLENLPTETDIPDNLLGQAGVADNLSSLLTVLNAFRG